ncbi:hypothetical protein K435DRAFT_414940 [Dendrothele bispora CBS 962.96]|uniref:Uncharacterized protein n=1 Tax=Dendrothele bispora (strain CBS 962.96) TaxID=1314807 RepID=A0A4V4HIJ7_DENBC|nr:hypothetical protein K435DRAFT_414940 [Dendrothele bispora CBS 962.96]
MSSFRNMAGSLDPFTSAYASMSQSSHSNELLGFSCNNSSQIFNPLTQNKRYDHSYPSPPPSHYKSSVPLPSLQLGQLGSLDRFLEDEDEEDSPMADDDPCWFPNKQVPISPPPTLPTPSHALPPTDDFFSLHQPDLRVSTSFSRSADDELEGQNNLLSPLSPEWNAEAISDMDSYPDESILLQEHLSGYGRSSDYSREAVADKKKDDIYCLKKCGLWTPRTSPVHLRAYKSSLSPYSPPSALPLYSELPPTVDSVPPYSRSPLSSPYHLSSIDEDVLLQSPATPSRRSCRTLPEPELQPSFRGLVDFDEPDLGSDTYMASPSPSSPTLALPGADMDDDYPISFSSHLERDSGSSIPNSPLTSSSPIASSSSCPFSSSSPSLPSPRSSSPHSLLLDDSEDPTPRSPSPDNFDLDSSLLLNLGDCSDPDIQDLVELRRRSLEAEHTAKSLERTMLDEGWTLKSSEARKTRKRAKERCKELSAMLKLRLGSKGEGAVMPSIADDEGVKSLKKRDGVAPTPGKKEKEVSIVRNMKQLVARMILKRKELDAVRTFTGRSCSREAGSSGKMRSTVLSPSPLKQIWIHDNDEGFDNDKRSRDDKMEDDLEDDDDDDDDDDIEMETGLNLSAFSEPPSNSNSDDGDPPWSMMMDS